MVNFLFGLSNKRKKMEKIGRVVDGIYEEVLFVVCFFCSSHSKIFYKLNDDLERCVKMCAYME